MTRPCGCGGNAATTCNCLIQAGPNTTVSGTGNPEDPYIVSAGQTTLAVTDTATIDHTLAGDATAGYSLSSDAKVSGAAGNALVANSDGLFVQAGSQGALVVGCGLAGTGSAASPLRLTSPQTVSGFAAAGAAVSYTSAQFCAGVSVTEASKLTITNPSTCQSMIVDVQVSGRIRLTALDAFNSAWAATMTFTLIRDGVDSGLMQSVTVGRPIAGAEHYHDERYPAAPVTLAPGGSTTLGYRMDSTVSGQCQIQAAVWNPPAVKAIGHLV